MRSLVGYFQSSHLGHIGCLCSCIVMEGHLGHIGCLCSCIVMEGHLGHIGCSCSYRVFMFMYID